MKRTSGAVLALLSLSCCVSSVPGARRRNHRVHCDSSRRRPQPGPQQEARHNVQDPDRHRPHTSRPAARRLADRRRGLGLESRRRDAGAEEHGRHRRLDLHQRQLRPAARRQLPHYGEGDRPQRGLEVVRYVLRQPAAGHHLRDQRGGLLGRPQPEPQGQHLFRRRRNGRLGAGRHPRLRRPQEKVALPQGPGEIRALRDGRDPARSPGFRPRDDGQLDRRRGRDKGALGCGFFEGHSERQALHDRHGDDGRRIFRRALPPHRETRVQGHRLRGGGLAPQDPEARRRDPLHPRRPAFGGLASGYAELLHRGLHRRRCLPSGREPQAEPSAPSSSRRSTGSWRGRTPTAHGARCRAPTSSGARGR